MVYRVYVEKKKHLANEAKALLSDVVTFLGIKNLTDVRIINRYDAENIDKELFEYAKKTVFSEPQLDDAFDEMDFTGYTVFAVEPLPGQFDQRADSASQCIQIISCGERPVVKTAKVYALSGNLTEDEVAEIKKYVINPVESREASLEKAETLKTEFEIPTEVKTLDGFIDLDEEGLKAFIAEYGLAMDIDDIRFCRDYFVSEKRNPTITEIRMIDTYWSDHCRHTTFGTIIDKVEFEDELLKKAYDEYIATREALGRTKPVCLMDIATLAVKYLRKNGMLEKLDESEEINACTVKIDVTVDGEKPIKVTASKAEENCIEFCSDGVTEFFSFEENFYGEDLSDFNLHRAVLKVLGITEKTKLVDGIKLETEVSSIDKGSGLGTSSILLAGCFRALGEILGTEFSDEEIFEKVFVAEQIMNTGGGWQDQAGGLVPGLKITSSKSGTEQKLTVKKISLSEKFEKFISEKFILIPTGQRHFGRFIVSNVAARYFERNEEALSAYSEMKVLNSEFLKSIEEENFSEFTNLINRHFKILRKISPAVSNEKIDALSESLLENCVDAVSVCGAGGGGYLLAVMKDNVSLSDVQKFIKNNFGYITGKVKKIDIFY